MSVVDSSVGENCAGRVLIGDLPPGVASCVSWAPRASTPPPFLPLSLNSRSARQDFKKEVGLLGTGISAPGYYSATPRASTTPRNIYCDPRI